MSSSPAETTVVWPLVVYFFCVIGLVCLMLLLAYAIGERRDHSRVTYPFESGIIPVGFARYRISVHYYLVAMFFVLFDLETVYILSWTISLRSAGWAGFAEAVIFILALLAGLAYIWRLGALNWAPSEGRAALVYKK